MLMKTVISIPEDVFVSASRLAKRLNISRSELCTRAVQQYIAKYRHAGVKEKLDQVYAAENSSVDPAVLNAQEISVPAEEW
jgi:metal-responsive CopG/Arc/MetJ family transcriptional regulator